MRGENGARKQQQTQMKIHCEYKVDIYSAAAGMIDLPTEQECLRLMSEMQTEQQPLRLYA